MMRRSPIQRGPGFRRPQPAAPVSQEERERLKTARLRALLDAMPVAARGVYEGTTGDAQPKAPPAVNPHLRNLARGQACTGLRYGSYCHCDPATTVLAHSNALAHGKGMARKAADWHSAHLGFDCHAWLDQGAGTAEDKAAFFAAAHARTVACWQAIAADRTTKPWRRDAAQWALDQLAKT